jgi:UDP-glucose 6-dehydrogenase
MRNLLALFAAAALTLAGVGWYLGWYTVEHSPAPVGHRAVHIDIDGQKMSADIRKGEEKLQEALDKNLKEDTTKRADSTPDGASKPPPNQ